MADPSSVFNVEPHEAEPEEALEARLDAEAEAAYQAGRIVPHDEVVKWLRSWGTLDELPPPTP